MIGRLAPAFLLLAACGQEGASEAIPIVEAQVLPIVALSVSEVAAMRHAPEPPVLIDVRTPGEYADGHLPGARLMPLDDFDPGALDGENVVLYCRSGRRSAEAAAILADHRGETTAHMAGGFIAWQETGQPVEIPAD